jgi:hypothetical protein
VGDGGFAHVVIHFVVGGGFEDVIFGFGIVAEGFEVKTKVEVSVAEVVAAASSRPSRKSDSSARRSSGRKPPR